MRNAFRIIISLVFLIKALPTLPAADKPAAAPASAICNRVRFYPAPDSEQSMVGGRFTGSNASRTNGFEVLAEIKTAPPAKQWSELTFDNQKVYRWLRYEGPHGSHAKIAELEFYAGNRKLSGKGNAFGPVVMAAERSWQRALDENTRTWFESDDDATAYVGADLKDLATARTPRLDPTPADFDGPTNVTIRCATPGAVIRYTLDGTMPTVDHGLVYQAPLRLKENTTLEAVAFLEGRAPSPPAYGTYLIGGSAKPGLNTFHVGNSLTQTTSMLGQYARTAGYRHDNKIFARPGAWTKELWDIGLPQEKERWEGLWNGMPHVDHLTLQPRDFNIDEEAGYDIKFFNLVRQKSPNMQPWLYCEWTEMKRQRPTDLGTEPSTQMKTLYPALTWEESMSAMLLYMEDLQKKVIETYHEGKRPRVLPTALAMGWIKNMIDCGQFPGLAPGSFYPALFNDQVHPSVNPLINAHGNGGYLVDLTWFAAFYRESPEGKVLPLGTLWTPEQSTILQRLAWDVIRNYPDCGLYEEGKTPAGKPVFTPAPGRLKEVTRVTLASSTPGAWFRYTLDGTTPTRTRGYVYCGVISVRPGMKVKAVAYQSGMADSTVAEVEFGVAK